MTIRSVFKKMMGEANAARLRRLAQLLLLPARLGVRRHCACCELSFRNFLPFYGKSNVRCPFCNSLPRQRFQSYLLGELLTTGAKFDLLHFAPEFSHYRRLKRDPRVRSVTADALLSFIPGVCVRPDVVADIRDLPFPGASFDLLLCNHVLEHIVEDDRAIAELHRVLRPGGTALVTVPVRPDGLPTLEEDWINTDELRHLHYGAVHHVRAYGMDVAEQFAAAGFAVGLVRPRDRFPSARIKREGLDPHEPHFLLRKMGCGASS